MLQTILRQLNQVKKTGKGFTARCPAHDDRHNSLSLMQAEDGTILIKCHAGCETAHILQALNLTFADLFPQTETKPAREKNNAASGQIEAVYPYQDEHGQLLYEVVRTRPKGFFQRRPDGKGGYHNGLSETRRVLYHLPQVLAAVRASQPILLCEGEKDADAAAALLSSGCATTAPMGAGKWREEYTKILAGARVVLCPDNDETGRRHMETVAAELLAAGCSVALADVTKFCPELLGRKGADLSDYLKASADPGAALRDLLSQAAPMLEYTVESAAEYLQQGFLEEIALHHAAPALHSGFPSLDRQLGGRLYDGLYIVGSISSMGKSAFVAQIACNIAAQGHPVLFFSLEMSRAEMTARCLGNLLFEKDPLRYAEMSVTRLLYGDMTAAEMADLLALAAHPALKNLTFIEGNFDLDTQAVREHIRRHRQAVGATPVVFLDYLQILRAPDPRLSDKQATDMNVIELKRIARDERIPLFAVSSFNRQNYAAEASFAAFKESGAIEYSADVVLALQAQGISEMSEDIGSEREAAGLSRDIARITRSAKARSPRALEVVTLKNRRGVAFARFPVDFYAKTSYFCEPEAALGQTALGL